MSTVSVQPSTSAADSIGYGVYGRTHADRARHREQGTTRAAWVSCTLDDPDAFVERAEALARAHGRKNELQNYVLAFSPTEFDPRNPGDVDRVGEVARALTESMHSADHLIAVHDDADHLHAHIYVINHDNLTGRALSRYTSWTRGLHQINDEVMTEHGLQTLPTPERALPDWEQRREEFTPGGFERELGDRVYAALADPRSTDVEGFTRVLAEHDVRLAVTERDGWSYKMRRSDKGGRWGRKKASRLTPEFTAEGAGRIFEHHATRQQTREQTTRSREEHRHGVVGRVGDQHEQGRRADRADRTGGCAAVGRQGHAAGSGVDHAEIRRRAERIREDRRVAAERAERDRRRDAERRDRIARRGDELARKEREAGYDGFSL